jgi:sialate O-acetylesterase
MFLAVFVVASCSATAKAGDDKKWSLKIATPEAGGPHQVVVKGKNEVKFDDVLIGEVLDTARANPTWNRCGGPIGESGRGSEERRPSR